MMENKRFKIGSLLYKEESKITKAKRDLELFSKLLNDEITKNIKSGYLSYSDLTDEVIKELAMFETGKLLEIIRLKFVAEADNIKFKPARDKFLEGCQTEINNIANQYCAAKEYVKERIMPGSFYFREYKNRIPFLIVKVYENDFNITFDSSNIEEHYTVKVETEKQADILNRAYELYESLVELNKELSEYTNGNVTVISGSKYGFIEFANDSLVFNPEVIVR